MENFNELFAAQIQSGTILVDFFAEWCGPCKMLAPVVQTISNERPDITVIKVNIDEHAPLAMQYKIVSIPTLIVFKDGKESARIVGYCSKDEILAKL